MTGRTTHGHTRGRKNTPTFNSWLAIKARCENPKSDRYSRYGGRGITICERWKSFENFLADMGECPDGMTIERINKDGNYEPTNCRWANITEQANNRSNNRLIEYNGKTQTVAEWARELGISYAQLQSRLDRDWPLDIAMDPSKSRRGVRKEELAAVREYRRNQPKESLTCQWCGEVFERKTVRSRTCSDKCHRRLVQKESYERNKDAINAKRREKWAAKNG